MSPPVPSADIHLPVVAPPSTTKQPSFMMFGLVGLVIVLVVAGGAFGAAALLGSGGPGPARIVPGSAPAFAALDLDVSTDQQRVLSDLAGHVPDLADVETPEQFVGLLVDRVDEQAHLDGALDGWVGLTAAQSLWMDSAGNPFSVVSVASTDDARAEQKLSGLHDGLGCVVSDGVAVVAARAGTDGDPQAAAEAAAAEIGATPLAQEPRFAEADGWLDDEVVSAWVDLGAVGDLITAALDRSTDVDLSSIDASLTGLDGQIAVGGHAMPFGLELRARTFGIAEVDAPDTGLLDRMAELPPSDLAVMGVLPQDLSGADGLIGALMGMGVTADTGRQVRDFLDAASGATVTATVDGIGDPFSGELSVETGSASDARAVAEVLDAILTGVPSAAGGRLDGSTYRYRTPGHRPADGRLDDVPAFADAVDTTVQGANLALYLDMSAVDSRVDAVAALGLVSGVEDGQSLFVARVVFA